MYAVKLRQNYLTLEWVRSHYCAARVTTREYPENWLHCYACSAMHTNIIDTIEGIYHLSMSEGKSPWICT